MSNEAIRRMLQVGDDYAVTESKHAYRPVRAMYLGDAPYAFGGSNRARLYSAPKGSDRLVYEDGCYHLKNGGSAHLTRLGNPCEVLVGDTMWIIAPNTSGWQASPYGGGKGTRGMFAVKNDDGEVERIIIVAYGVNIVSPWDVEEKRQAEQDARREQDKRDREFEREWSLALVHETIRICDERGYSDGQIKDVLDEYRSVVVEYGERGWSMYYRPVERAQAFLIGAGVLDPTDKEK